MAAKIGLIFHGIGQPGRALEPGEAPYWVSIPRFEAILDRILALPDPSRIRISFDDGNASDIQIALPRLLDRGLSADFFALAGRLDQPGSLRAADLAVLVQAGMRLGSHGVDHLNLRRLPPDHLSRELAQSRDKLEQALGQRISDFSIPFGAYDGRVLRAIRQAGYHVAWSSDRGRFAPNAFLRPRTSCREDMDDAAIDRILKGQLTGAEALRRHLGMLRRRF